VANRTLVGQSRPVVALGADVHRGKILVLRFVALLNFVVAVSAGLVCMFFMREDDVAFGYLRGAEKGRQQDQAENDTCEG
jgi:hypothetical protein